MAFGVPGKGMQKSFNFSIDNNVEMKIKSDKDTTGVKKISLIDQLSANMSYNAAAKTRPWSDLSMNLRLKLTKSYTFSMNAVFATYAYEFDKNGNVVVGDHTEWGRGRFGRFQGMSQNISYTFNKQTLKKWLGFRDKISSRLSSSSSSDDEDMDDEETDPTMQNLDPERKKSMKGTEESSSAEVDADGYLKFQMPWSLSVSYGISMREDTSAKINPKRMRYPYRFNQTLNFSGNVRISEGWNINFSSGYDFNYKKLSMTTVSLARDLHCFSMSCSMVLMPYRSFNFNFQADASALRDVLRWRKQSSYSSNIEWY